MTVNLKAMVGDLIELGLTQKEIGEAIGRDQSTISDIRRGKSKRPPYDTVEALRKFHTQQMRARAA